MVVNDAWYRFGLPLGSAIVLVAILDTTANMFSAWMDLGAVVVYHINQTFTIDGVTIIWVLIILVWNAANLGFLWIGVIIKGNVTMLIAWIVTTVICGIIVIGVWIYTISNAWSFKMYILSEFYSLLTYLVMTGYMLNIAIQCLKPLKNNEPLEPIGKGIPHLLKFYRDDPTLTAKFLLISELVIIAEYVFTRLLMKFAFGRGMGGHEGDTSAAIIAEEYVIRGLRFVISSFGIYFVTKGKLAALKYWGLVYLGTIISSVGIFFFLLAEWSSEHPFFTVIYYLIFLLGLIYRSAILYMCMKVIQPYTNSNSFLTLHES